MENPKDTGDLEKSLDTVLAAINDSSGRRERQLADPATVLETFVEELAKIEDAELLKSMGIATLEEDND
jgi:hypothetical protein